MGSPPPPVAPGADSILKRDEDNDASVLQKEEAILLGSKQTVSYYPQAYLLRIDTTLHISTPNEFTIIHLHFAYNQAQVPQCRLLRDLTLKQNGQ